MDQLQYDIYEFVLNNKKEIVVSIEDSTAHILICKRLFDKCPDLFDNLLTSFKVSKLRHLVAEHFECDFSQVCEIINESNIEELLKC